MKKIIYALVATLLMACTVPCLAQTVSGSKGGHDYVNLGLPSGRLWATCNVGASQSVEWGNYLSWGESRQKNYYGWTTYKLCNKEYYKPRLTKYCADSIYGTVDSLTTLLAEDDAATQNWGVAWRVPTLDELKELIDGCKWKWTDKFNGFKIPGLVGISKANGNTIFFPAAGQYFLHEVKYLGNFGYYWSSSLGTDAYNGKCLAIDPEKPYVTSESRDTGLTIRAVVK